MNKERYVRQTLLGEIGEEGQDRLLDAHVVVIGCGGLGSIAAPYLAGAGVGRLTLVDGDSPDISNLHRQVFFSSEPYSAPKAQVLAAHIQKLNPEVQLGVIAQMLSKENIASIIQNGDVVLECTDNIQTKYMVNDYCALQNIPMVYGAIHKYDGYVSFFENRDDQSIHLRDIFAEPNDEIPSCSEVGVMGTLAGMIGLMQANEAIKYISGAGQCLSGTMLTYNILNNDQMKLRLKKTYAEDLKSVYLNSNYISDQICATFEISLHDVIRNREKYNLVSILEDYEHEDIDADVVHTPLSQIDPKSWDRASEKPTIFYCLSGVRSGNLVTEILSNKPEENVLSLSGGLKSFKKSKT